MGAGASASECMGRATEEELRVALAGLGAADKKRLSEAVSSGGQAASGPEAAAKVSEATAPKPRESGWSGSPEWALDFMENLCAIQGDFDDDGQNGSDTSFAAFATVLGGRDLNATVDILWESRSMCRRGSFGDQHYSITEYSTRGTLFAAVLGKCSWAAAACLHCGADPKRWSTSMRYYDKRDLKDSDKRTEVVLEEFLPLHVAVLCDEGCLVPLPAGVASKLSFEDSAAERCGVFKHMRKSHLYSGKGHTKEKESATCSQMADLVREVRRLVEPPDDDDDDDENDDDDDDECAGEGGEEEEED